MAATGGKSSAATAGKSTGSQYPDLASALQSVIPDLDARMRAAKSPEAFSDAAQARGRAGYQLAQAQKTPLDQLKDLWDRVRMSLPGVDTKPNLNLTVGTPTVVSRTPADDPGDQVGVQVGDPTIKSRTPPDGGVDLEVGQPVIASRVGPDDQAVAVQNYFEKLRSGK